MIRRPPRSTHCISSAASDVYKRQEQSVVIVKGYHCSILSSKVVWPTFSTSLSFTLWYSDRNSQVPFVLSFPPSPSSSSHPPSSLYRRLPLARACLHCWREAPSSSTWMSLPASRPILTVALVSSK
eukprot:TRINITY_DN1752_c0_g2_i2.p1 TRINITY_DN1752_c0_g2~~TRINITY_DN1752_c0_g2_i2.p1  ORF type:complete len:138 (-),score=10.85 TRINITY_DN1752_c0_g2_i2:781-1158(-)